MVHTLRHISGSGRPCSCHGKPSFRFEEANIMRKLLTGIMCMATGAALWCATPDEALAQKRGGGGNRGGDNRGNNNAGRVYSTPNPGYRGTDWRGSNWGGWNYGGWNYGYYPYGYG